MTSAWQPSAIRTAGQLEGLRNDVRLLRRDLGEVPLWRPGAALIRQCDEVLHLFDELKARFDRKLVVTLVGPCGAGKSTLLNALAGVDDLFPAGHQRPTTRRVVAMSREPADAELLRKRFGGDTLEIRSSRASSTLDHVILIDTPDTDSVEQEKHIPLVKRAIELSDVLLCVFNAENPKTRVHADFLAPFVRLFHGESLVAILNKCDRLDHGELKETILPDFIDFLDRAWDQPVQTVLCMSARRHLEEPGWSPQAMPRHDFDQFEDLERMILGDFNQPGFVIDRRLENANRLRDFINDEIADTVAKNRPSLEKARREMQAAEQQAVQESLDAFQGEDARHPVGVNVMLYQKLAQRWMGPVGWLIAVWARLLIFGSGLISIFRFGNPIRQIIGMVTSFKRFTESREALREAGRGERLDAAMHRHRRTFLRIWPGIAEVLIRGGFDPAVRQAGSQIPESGGIGDRLSGMWGGALEMAVDRAARRLSTWPLQLVLNAPTVGLMAHAGWRISRAYFAGHYLASHVFLHTFLTIGIALVLSFFFFQVLVRMAGSSDRITRLAVEWVASESDHVQATALHPVGRQLEQVLGLTIPPANAD